MKCGVGVHEVITEIPVKHPEEFQFIPLDMNVSNLSPVQRKQLKTAVHTSVAIRAA